MARSKTSGSRFSWKGLFKWGVGLFVAALVALGIAVGIAYNSLPEFDELAQRDDLGQMVRVRAADGTILVSMGPTFGRWLSYDQIPSTMTTALIAVEDRRYRYHPGVDPIGIGRGLYDSVARGHRVRAVSTITQQLARNIFLTNDRSFGRKLKEGVLALALSLKFSKNDILELYLNRVYFGGGSYGIDAASRTFFGHSADEMTLGEAAIIAGLVKAPSNYSPTADLEAARGRAGVVIDSMVRYGFITPAQAAGIDAAEIKVQPRARLNSSRYFTDWALPQLDTLIDETREPIDVWTTLDLRMQEAADRAINANTPAGAQGALVAIDRDGAVKAMVGGRDYVDSMYNRATQAERQPGSSFKLFVYLTALENGMSPTDEMVDEPVTIDGWTPRNSTRSHVGPVTLRQAFARSINTISAKIGEKFGFGTIADMARRFGIGTEVRAYPSMVLGTNNVRLIDMTRAFASVQNRGNSVMPYAIKKVVTGDGRLLYQTERSEERVLVAPWVAAGMTDLMQTAVLSGTGRAAQIGRPVAGKTGTTQSNKDGWFVGFSSGLTTGVWMGRDDNRSVRGLQGGTAPARAFADFMKVAVANRPVEEFETEVPMPDWSLEPDEEFWAQEYEDEPIEPLVDENGMPIGPQPYDPLAPAEGGQLEPRRRGPDPSELDRILNGPPPPPAPTRQQPVRQDPQQQQSQQQRRSPSDRQADPLQPRPDPPQG